MADTRTVAEHYGRADLGSVILAALSAVGKDIDHLEPDDLVPIDELHSRGRESTIDLARILDLKGNEAVLDVGCGIGGPSRYLAKTYGCHVAGLDLTPEFCQVAAMLAERTGLAGEVEYRQGDALAMPFADRSFDVVWSPNVAMNIANRDRLYREIRRVLRPDGRYAFSDVVDGGGGAPHFPVPWARDSSISFLLTAQATRAKLEAANFDIIAFEDQTARALARAEERMKPASAPLALGLHIVLGQDAPTMLKNMLRNYQGGVSVLFRASSALGIESILRGCAPSALFGRSIHTCHFSSGTPPRFATVPKFGTDRALSPVPGGVIRSIVERRGNRG